MYGPLAVFSMTRLDALEGLGVDVGRQARHRLVAEDDEHIGDRRQLLSGLLGRVGEVALGGVLGVKGEAPERPAGDEDGLDLAVGDDEDAPIHVVSLPVGRRVSAISPQASTKPPASARAFLRAGNAEMTFLLAGKSGPTRCAGRSCRTGPRSRRVLLRDVEQLGRRADRRDGSLQARQVVAEVGREGGSKLLGALGQARADLLDVRLDDGGELPRLLRGRPRRGLAAVVAPGHREGRQGDSDERRGRNCDQRSGARAWGTRHRRGAEVPRRCSTSVVRAAGHSCAAAVVASSFLYSANLRQGCRGAGHAEERRVGLHPVRGPATGRSRRELLEAPTS